MLTMDNLIEWGCISSEAAEYLKACVKAGVNILVSGGYNAGKTHFLNILATFIPEGEERLILGQLEGPGAALDTVAGKHGVLATIEADSPQQAAAKMDVTSFELIVQLLQLRDDSRKIMHIAEVAGGEADAVVLTDIFFYEETGMEDGKITGKTVATGHVPAFGGMLSV